MGRSFEDCDADTHVKLFGYWLFSGKTYALINDDILPSFSYKDMTVVPWYTNGL